MCYFAVPTLGDDFSRLPDLTAESDSVILAVVKWPASIGAVYCGIARAAMGHNFSIIYLGDVKYQKNIDLGLLKAK